MAKVKIDKEELPRFIEAAETIKAMVEDHWELCGEPAHYKMIYPRFACKFTGSNLSKLMRFTHENDYAYVASNQLGKRFLFPDFQKYVLTAQDVAICLEKLAQRHREDRAAARRESNERVAKRNGIVRKRKKRKTSAEVRASKLDRPGWN